ncbi:MAG: hypothetical protein Q4A59_04020, partial [Erysipelotrichaceae bacterium]|nr:hypothetical protein [Erysipelotrichaceae bacterium]
YWCKKTHLQFRRRLPRYLKFANTFRNIFDNFERKTASDPCGPLAVFSAHKQMRISFEYLGK